MINQCCGKYNFSLNTLIPERLKRAEELEETLPEIKIDEIELSTYQCPILCEKSIPALMVKKGEPILNGLERVYMNRIIDNPLLILFDPVLKSKFKSRIDHAIGLDTYAELYKNGVVKSPYTRDVIVSVVCLGDHNSHTKSTKHSLGSIVFGKKLIGSYGSQIFFFFFF